jgi:hypothetical protein
MSLLQTIRFQAYRRTASSKLTLHNIPVRTFSITPVFKMSPIPIVVFGRKAEIASKVREDMLPEYEGNFSYPNPHFSQIITHQSQ